ncbi:MAG: outer membrane protein assembly factor BamD, partial [Bacteroidota bacterium]
MKSSFFFTLVVAAFLVGFSSCKSEFERIRSSSDSELLYKEAFEYYDEGEYLKAQTLFELIISGLRGKVEAEKVYFYYAYTHYHLRKFISSNYYFKNFANTFPNSQYREEADYMMAFSHYRMSPSFRLDQTYSEKAIEGFQLFVNTYPTSERVEKCNLLIDEMRRKMERKSMDEAQLYFDLRQYQASIHSFENMLRDFPETTNAEKIRYMMVKSSYLLAVNSIFEKKAERFEESEKYAELFLARYDKSEYREEVKSIKKTAAKQIRIVGDKQL